MPRPEILLVCGSPRSRGNTEALVSACAKGAKAAGAACRVVRLAGMVVTPCNGCERCRKDRICTRFPDGMQGLYPAIESARGLVLGSPTHNYNVSALMKAFIDRLYCFYDFDDQRPRGWSSRLAGLGKKAAALAVAEQVHASDMGFTLEAMTRPLEALGYEITGTHGVLGHFDRGSVKNDLEALEGARALGGELARALAD